MHRVTRRRLTGLLALLCVAEISLAVAAWRDGPSAKGSLTARVPAAVSSLKPSAPVLETVPLASFRAFVERPLFLASRRPAPAEGGAPASRTTDLSAKGVIFGPYKFTGIVMTPKVRIAFVTEMKTGRSIALAEGEKLGDWRCAEITPDSVALEKEGRREVIELHARN